MITFKINQSNNQPPNFFLSFQQKIWKLLEMFHELSATWSSGRSSCPWQGHWNWTFYKVPSSPNRSMIQ